MAKTINPEPLVTPESISPQSASDFIGRAWLYYGTKKFENAVEDFQKATQMDSSLAEAYYGLGLSLKEMKKPDLAIESFNHAAEIITLQKEEVRNQMLLRLIHGQINFLKIGDWNLEKELWHRDL